MDWSGNEDDMDVFMEESAVAGPSGTTHRYVRNKRANDHSNVFAVAVIVMTFWYVFWNGLTFF